MLKGVEKQMKYKKLNIIDVIIITIIILIAAAVSLRAISEKHIHSSLKDKEVIYTVEIYNLDKSFINSVNQNEKLYLTGKSLFCGEVLNVSSKYSTQDIEYENKTIKTHTNPEQINMSLTVQVTADLSDSGFYIGNNTFITKGTVLDMHTNTFSFVGKIVEISYENE